MKQVHVDMGAVVQLVDTETGAIDIYKRQPTSEEKMAAAARKEAYRDRSIAIDAGRSLQFTLINTRTVGELTTTISDKHAGYLLVTQTYVGFDGILRSNGRGSQPLGEDAMQKLLKLKRNTFGRFWTEMIAHDVLQVLSDGRIQMNENYHFKGSKGDKDMQTVRSFSVKIRELFERGAKAQDLGFLYKLLPYIHIEQNWICSNPEEPDTPFINVLTINEIAEVTGADRKTVANKLRMEICGERVFRNISESDKKESAFMVNPSVIWRQVGKPPKAITDLFKIKLR